MCINMGKSPLINPLILVRLGSCPSSSDKNTCFWLGNYCPNSTWSYLGNDQDSEPWPQAQGQVHVPGWWWDRPLGLRTGMSSHHLPQQDTGVSERAVLSPFPEPGHFGQCEHGGLGREKSANAGRLSQGQWDTQLR